MSKREIVNAFRIVHRAAKKAFDGDIKTLTAAKLKINEEFRKDLKENEKLEAKLKTAEEVAKILDKQVVQLVKESESDKYKMNLRKETHFDDNSKFSSYLNL
jgi:complex III assembly factor LYRM7